MNLTAVDAETIIRLATYDIVHLELRATPIHVPENHITYVTENIATHLCVTPLVLSLILYKSHTGLWQSFTLP